MNSKNRKVKILWTDALIFSPKRKGDTPLLKKEEMIPSQMKTTGVLESDLPDYLLIKNPITIKLTNKTKHPLGKRPSFYLIPKGMIRSVKPLRR